MKPTDLLREITFPATDLAALFAMFLFAFVATIVGVAVGAGPLGWFILPLAVITLPAFFRFAMNLLDARANRHPVSPPGIELFSWIDGFQSLFPLVLLALLIWAGIVLHVKFLPAMANTILGLLLLIYPASLAVLGATRSPTGSLNPVNLYNMIRLCGWQYVLIPLVIIPMTAVAALLFALNSWLLARNLAVCYVVFLLFSLTGAVMRENGVMNEVDIDRPRTPDVGQLSAALQKTRQQTANHAYGFASRGNRSSALRHIHQYVTTEVDTTSAYEWFFREMLAWESRDTALVFAQEYLAYLLGQGNGSDAIKLITRCLHEDVDWKPLQRDRYAACILAKQRNREDLLRFLES